MVGRPAGHYENLIPFLNLFLANFSSSNLTRCCGCGRSSFSGSLRLLEDLLEHEMVEPALFGGFRIPVNVVDVAFDRAVEPIEDLYVSFVVLQLPVIDQVDIPGMV